MKFLRPYLSVFILSCLAAVSTLHGQAQPGSPGGAAVGTALKPSAAAPSGGLQKSGLFKGLPNRVRIDEKLGESIPLELRFKDEDGKPVALKDYFDEKRPVIITMNYSSCKMLCSMQLTALVEGLKDLELLPGKDFRILTVSMDPMERSKRAIRTKRKYLALLAKPEAEPGWHFLTVDERLPSEQDESSGDVLAAGESQTRKLADALGYGYQFDPETAQYHHIAVLMVLSPTGKVCRYLYRIDSPGQVQKYRAATLKKALIEASSGKIGSVLDRVILYCFLSYDKGTGQYTATVFTILRAAGIVFLLAIGILFWRISVARKKNRAAQASAAQATTV